MTQVLEDRIEMKALLRETGMSPYDLHYWVRRGLLPPYCASRSYGCQGSEYFYPARAVELAKKIKALREIGAGCEWIKARLKGEGLIT